MDETIIQQEALQNPTDIHQVASQDPTDEEIHVEEVGNDDKPLEKEICEENVKKGSPAWDYFVKIKGCPIGKEKAKCSLCSVVIGCNSRNGTSAMMTLLKTVCPIENDEPEVLNN